MIDVFTANFSFIIISIPIKRIYFKYLLLCVLSLEIYHKICCVWLGGFLKVLLKIEAFAVEEPQDVIINK